MLSVSNARIISFRSRKVVFMMKILPSVTAMIKVAKNAIGYSVGSALEFPQIKSKSVNIV